MTLELAQVVSAWPLGVSLAAVVAARGLYAGRRRSALNEALHELRRPLQALALAPGPAPGRASPFEGSVRMAAAALERLEREINGGAVAPACAPVPVRPLLESAVERWSGRATLAGRSLSLRCQAGEALVEGDRCELGQAIDNLIVNAIEHGGPEVAVAAELRRDRVRVAVRDSGRESRPGRSVRPTESLVRLVGGSRRGHGLRVVRRTAAAHGGEFALRHSTRGTEAVLELPIRAAG